MEHNTSTHHDGTFKFFRVLFNIITSHNGSKGVRGNVKFIRVETSFLKISLSLTNSTWEFNWFRSVHCEMWNSNPNLVTFISSFGLESLSKLDI
jgi:hypothetical protein